MSKIDVFSHQTEAAVFLGQVLDVLDYEPHPSVKPDVIETLEYYLSTLDLDTDTDKNRAVLQALLTRYK